MQALKSCELANQSDLIIYSDAPRFVENIKNVDDVRFIIRNLTGFKSIKIIERHQNLGLSNSIIHGVTEVLERYDEVIVLEDDLVCSKNFLRFMNDGLNYFRGDDRINSIQGYVYPGLGNFAPNGFFLKGADCWGWATWKRVWKLLEWNGTKLLTELRKNNLTFEFDFDGSFPYTRMLEDQVKGLNDSWAIRWYASSFLDNKLSFYPGLSLVKNIGNDGTGTNSANTANFDTSINDYDFHYSNQIKIEETLIARNLYINFFNKLNSEKIFLRRILQYVLISSKKVFSRGKNLSIKLTKLLTPPLLLQIANHLLSKPFNRYNTHYVGPYEDWNSAAKFSDGYNHELIRAKVFESAKLVSDGYGLYAQDSVVFKTYEFSQTLSLGLLIAASSNNGQIKVLDIGGGLGVSYYKHYPILNDLKSIEWRVVEQSSYVDFAQQNLNSGPNLIAYYSRIEDAIYEFSPNIVIFSAALQYFEDSASILAEIMNIMPSPIIVIDRLPVSQLSTDIVAIEKVPKKIYNASYPLWIFSKDVLLNKLHKKWLLILNIQTPESWQKVGYDIKFNYEGFVFCPRNKKIFTECSST